MTPLQTWTIWACQNCGDVTSERWLVDEKGEDNLACEDCSDGEYAPRVVIDLEEARKALAKAADDLDTLGSSGLGEDVKKFCYEAADRARSLFLTKQAPS